MTALTAPEEVDQSSRIAVSSPRRRYGIASLICAACAVFAYCSAVYPLSDFFGGMVALVSSAISVFAFAVCLCIVAVPSLATALDVTIGRVWPIVAPRPAWLTLTLNLLFVLFCVYLAECALIGTTSRYLADDYSVAVAVRDMGLPRAYAWFYHQWCGRFSYYAVAATASLLTRGNCSYLTICSIAFWFIGSLSIACSLAEMGIVLRRYRFVLAILPCAATLFLFSNENEAMYWQAGDCTYGLPVALLFCQAAMLLRISISKPASNCWIAACMASSFLLAGFHEFYGPLQSIWYFVAFAFAPAFHAGRRLGIAYFGCLLTAVIGTLIVAHSPGNSVRAAGYPARPSGLHLIHLTAYFFHQFAVTVGYDMTPLTVYGGVAALCARSRPARASRFALQLAIAFAAGVASIYTCYLITTYATSAAPLHRVTFVPTTISVVCALSIGLIIGGFLKAKYVDWISPQLRAGIDPALIGIAVYLLLIAFWHTPYYIASKRVDYVRRVRLAKDWQAKDAYLKSHPGAVLHVSKDDYKAWNLSSDPRYWINAAVAKYYRLRSIDAE